MGQNVRYRSERPQSTNQPCLTFKTERISPKPVRHIQSKKKKKSQKSVPTLNAHSNDDQKSRRQLVTEDSRLRLLVALNDISRLKSQLLKSESQGKLREEASEQLREQISKLRVQLQNEKLKNQKLCEVLEEKQLMLTHLRGKVRQKENRGQSKIDSTCKLLAGTLQEEFQQLRQGERIVSFSDFVDGSGAEQRSSKGGREPLCERQLKLLGNSMGMSDEEQSVKVAKKQKFKRKSSHIPQQKSGRTDKLRKPKK